MVSPYALLIVMAKLSLIGNCFLLNLNENISSSEGQRGIPWRNTHCPACCPTMISASIRVLLKPTNSVYLQFKRAREHPIRGQQVKKLGRVVAMQLVLRTIEAMVDHLLTLKCSMIHMFIPSTLSFFVERVAREVMQTGLSMLWSRAGNTWSISFSMSTMPPADDTQTSLGSRFSPSSVPLPTLSPHVGD